MIMKPSSKAALLCAFVFPGAGYFTVKQLKRGIISIAIVCASLLTIAREIYKKAVIIAEQIADGTLPFDMLVIHQKANEALSTLPTSMLTTLSVIIASIWIFSIIDCYRLGKKIDGSDS